MLPQHPAPACTPEQAHVPADRNGQPIHVGDRVRIVGIPELSGMSGEGLAQTLPVFQYLVGKYKRVRSFDAHGCAELSFVVRRGDGERIRHSVWIEPFLLHLPQRQAESGAEAGASRKKRHCLSMPQP